MRGEKIFLYSVLLFTIGYVRFRVINITDISQRSQLTLETEVQLKSVSFVKSNKIWTSHGMESNGTSGCPKPVRLASNLLRTALVSFAGSGNTWIRHLLETMTGLATGSMYNDTTLKNVFLGEGRTDESVLVVKTHATSPSEQWTRAILLIRNPFECLISEFNRRMSKNHTGISEKFDNRIWEQVYWKFETRWVPVIRNWLKLTEILVVFYDHLLMDLDTQLRRILQFLLVPGNVTCALQDPEGSFHRKTKSKVDFKMIFNADKTTAMNKSIDFIFKQLSYRFPQFDFGFMLLWKRHL